MIEGEVAELLLEGDARARGRAGVDGVGFPRARVILTAGTFLNGVIHIGDQRSRAAGWAIRRQCVLAEQLDDLALPVGRLKTGTPPRLDGRTIDWDKLEMQPGDEDPTVFSFLNTAARSAPDRLRHHAYKRSNAPDRARQPAHVPLCMVAISKASVRATARRSRTRSCALPTRPSHQVFLEPEGLDDHTVYPNGISTSLPEDVQEAYVRYDSRAWSRR